MLNRLLGIVYSLMKNRQVTASELAERYEVSVRTIYRDVETLSMAGIPLYTMKGRNGGIRLMEQFVLDKLLVSKEEQQQILAALNSLDQVGGKEEGEILGKLMDFFQEDAPSWVSIDLSDWSGKRQGLFEVMKQAVIKCRVLEFDYYGQNGLMSHRIVEPVQLLFKEYTWYLSAYCREKKAMRLFKALRMKRLKMMEESFFPHRENNYKESQENQIQDNQKIQESQENQVQDNQKILDNHQDNHQERKEPQYQEQTRYTTITLKIEAKEAYRIYDRFEEEDIFLSEDGSYLVTVKCILDEWAYSLILSYGTSAIVLAPSEVREEIGRRVKSMAEFYS